MLLRYFPLLLLFSFHILFAQESFVQQKNNLANEIKTIDTLIYYNNFEVAEKKVDSLLLWLEQNENTAFETSFLELKYQKALILDELNIYGKSLSIFMDVLKESERLQLYKLQCKSNIRIAYNLEKSSNYYAAYLYLQKAQQLSYQYHFQELLSSIYLRLSMAHRFLGDPDYEHDYNELIKENVPLELFSIDSAFYYIEKSRKYAQIFNNENDVANGYMALGVLENNQRKDFDKAIYYLLQAIPFLEKTKNYETIGLSYVNIARIYAKQDKIKESLVYCDSAKMYFNHISLYYKWFFGESLSFSYQKAGLMDSAYHYLLEAYYWRVESNQREDLLKSKQIEEKYENDKKADIIKNQNQQILYFSILLAAIVLASTLLLLQNRKIRLRNKIINKQLIELTKTVEQKQVLLSELQHRVKNNLQHVISILEIQKESVDFNNIDELIRGNQNRILSMALLHKKLNVFDNVNEVDMKKYVSDLAELVKKSYDNHKKDIKLNVNCEIGLISIEKALPIGLIITELVSNSMKHAFVKQNEGIINVQLFKMDHFYQLQYTDNGIGFDFTKTCDKGLGQEIIKGLIDQINGTIETQNEHGFKLIISFKE